MSDRPDPSIRAVLKDAVARLSAAGVHDAAGDARRLLGHALNASPAGLIVDPGRCLRPAELAAFARLVDRRASREPVSRILGERDFYGRTFQVTPFVLDPRPDTETIVEETLRVIRDEGLDREPVRILDIGTGSGAILLTLLAELPRASGLGLDLSGKALACAAANAAALGLASRAGFEIGDLKDGLPRGFDIWVSNPPYIETGAIAGLDPEVRDFDPLLALDGGADGLDAYRAILGAARQCAGDDRPAWIVLEVGAGQSDAVIALARELQPLKVGVARDLGGHERCVSLSPQRRGT